MKTSKIIFITFFGVIGLFLLSLIIQTDPKNRGNRELQEMKREAFTLPSISHLIVHEGCNVRLTSGQADSIKIGYHKDLVLDHPVFSVSGDTLIIDKFPEDKGFFTELSLKAYPLLLQLLGSDQWDLIYQDEIALILLRNSLGNNLILKNYAMDKSIISEHIQARWKWQLANDY